MSRAPLLQTVIAIAEEAGESTLPFFCSEDNMVTEKQDGSPVSLADEAAHALIVSRLAEVTPDLPVVSEEQDNPAISHPRFWCVDPLDGTKEFLAGRPDFTVNIALVEVGKPTLGVIYCPATQTIYAADTVTAVAQHYQRDYPEDRQSLQVRGDPDAALTVVSSRLHAGGSKAQMETVLAPFKVAHALQVGSSLKFCYLAQGKADLYPRLGPTMIWDTAAGHAILLAAGGAVHRLEDSEQVLCYDSASLTNPFFIAYGWRCSLSECSDNGVTGLGLP